ncbi:MerR family transcriptional regulator [Nocardia sp. SYP-A9097]|uniref:MerR family transcriptional regulator n=1 Tax=Nocardia sp. SYP-A9097 TaxID=2663237 RepID=UPI00129BC127|nr:MerR family transcriptional regulator [Nocardia sp. SYP-A9097]MRH89359.1 MerR family transcriptional regulator [Nocardia sp. SYP-A9097]
MAVDAELTINDLAAQAGMTVRTLRDYNERGLLPPPKMKGRTGFYGAEHLNRVRIVERLLERGITLNGVRGLLEAWDRGEDLADVLGVATGTAPPRSEPATDGSVTAADLAERFREIPGGLSRAVTAGLYEPVDQNTYRATDPMLVEVFDELTGAGMPTERALDEIEQLRIDCDHIARQFTDIFLRTTVRSFRRSDRTAGDIDELTTGLAAARTRPGRVAAGVIDRFVERYLGSVVGRELTDVFPDGG